MSGGSTGPFKTATSADIGVGIQATPCPRCRRLPETAPWAMTSAGFRGAESHK